MKSGEKNNAMQYSTLAHITVLAVTRGCCLESIALSLFGVIMHSIGANRDFFFFHLFLKETHRLSFFVDTKAQYLAHVHDKVNRTTLGFLRAVVNQSSGAQTLC